MYKEFEQLKKAKPNSLLPLEFSTPYQGTIEDLRKEIAEHLPQGLTIGYPLEVSYGENEDGIIFIENVKIQVENSH